jgi:hypothetical protein
MPRLQRPCSVSWAGRGPRYETPTAWAGPDEDASRQVSRETSPSTQACWHRAGWTPSPGMCPVESCGCGLWKAVDKCSDIRRIEALDRSEVDAGETAPHDHVFHVKRPSPCLYRILPSRRFVEEPVYSEGNPVDNRTGIVDGGGKTGERLWPHGGTRSAVISGGAPCRLATH